MTTTTTTTDERTAILNALRAWVAQRPGLEFGNYGDVAAYREEQRGIIRDKKQAEILLEAVKWRTSITADDLKAAFRAYSGRLSWDGEKLDYCTGQYWPTEYRRAVCAVLAAALWDYAREVYPAKNGVELRAYFKREFGRTIARRWFN
jgi:hypothetical protein